MKTALLALLYYAVFTPVGLLLRLVKDPLHRSWNASATTYWMFVSTSSDR